MATEPDAGPGPAPDPEPGPVLTEEQSWALLAAQELGRLAYRVGGEQVGFLRCRYSP